MKYNLVRQGEFASLTLFHDNEMYVANQEHPNWTKIVEGVLAGDTKVVHLFDVANAIAEHLQLIELTDRVSVANGKVYFDGDPVDNALTRQIVRFFEEEVEDWVPLVEFYDKVQSNPNEHSRAELYRWLQDRDFTILEDGNFVAYKGVNLVNGEYLSVHSGRAFVNGVETNGRIPNAVGSVITMPRSAVQFDSTVGCSTGLHAGTWEYASGFTTGAILEVSINPRDVVSVPTDCNDQKLRVCRYEVTGVLEAPLSTALKIFDDFDEDDGEYDYDDDCSEECQVCADFYAD